MKNAERAISPRSLREEWGNRILLAAKRLWRGRALPAFCLLLTAAVFAASFLADADSLTPAGICSLDNSPVSLAVTERLVGDGFLPYESEADLRRDLAKGKLDAAVLLPAGFGDALLSDDPAGCALFLTASGAFVPELFRNQAAAALFAEKTPYRTAYALQEAGSDIPAEEVFREYGSLMDAGSLFSFRILWEEDGADREQLPPTYVMGTLGILLTAGMVLGTAGLLTQKSCEPAGRIGGKRAFLTLTLPSLAVQVVCCGLAATAGLLLSACFGRGECLPLILSAWIFLLLLTGSAALLQTVLSRSEAVYGFIFVETVLSLLLLPLWADAALLFPILGKLRILLPPWWLWLAADHPVLSVLIAMPLCTAGGYALYRELTRRALKP